VQKVAERLIWNDLVLMRVVGYLGSVHAWRWNFDATSKVCIVIAEVISQLLNVGLVEGG
jgi:hypothetical protein